MPLEKSSNHALFFALRGHADARETWRVEHALAEAASAGGAEWAFTAQVDATHVRLGALRRAAGASDSVSLELVLRVADWSTAHYVFAPGAVYAGNRFPVRPQPYSPRLAEADVAEHAPFITDVPRLSHEPGPSRLDLLAGDLAFPAIGYQDAERGTGVLLIAASHQSGREVGFTIVESDDRGEAELRVSVPGVRARRYEFPRISTDGISPDRGVVLAPGESLALEVRVYVFAAATVAEFLDRAYALRSTAGPRTQPAELPLSAAADLIVRKNDAPDHWNETLGIYPIDFNPASPWYFQTGWCGGFILPWAILDREDEPSRSRARRNLQVVLEQGMAPSGLFWGKRLSNGMWTADYQHDPRTHLHRWTLTRRQGDALYFGLRQLTWLDARGETVPSAWDAALRRCAETLLATFQRHGQLGHYLDQYTGELVIGGSCSAGIVPAAWILAEKRWGGGAFQRAASALAEQLHRDHVARGFTTGGPGDAMQAPDSESAAAVLESFVELAEFTGQVRWVARARTAAALLASWVMPYDYPFPAGSEFHRLGMGSVGSVFANAQNKHSAPGICTHSGLGLLRLFRLTGDERHLQLLTEIARALPQYVSRDDRPIIARGGRPQPAGWINERVNTSDWDANVGGVFSASCWCEVSLLLTWHEVPGVYAQPDTGLISALDNVEATWADGARTALRLTNPTRFPAHVRLLVETSARARSGPLPGFAAELPTVELPAGSTISHSLR